MKGALLDALRVVVLVVRLFAYWKLVSLGVSVWWFVAVEAIAASRDLERK